MLYKNLPQTYFIPVFAMRVIFDFAALLHFSLTEGGAHGKAVAKAYRDFFKLKSSMMKARPLASKLTKEAQSKKPFSIAVSYYLKGRKTYTEI